MGSIMSSSAQKNPSRSWKNLSHLSCRHFLRKGDFHLRAESHSVYLQLADNYNTNLSLMTFNDDYMRKPALNFWLTAQMKSSEECRHICMHPALQPECMHQNKTGVSIIFHFLLLLYNKIQN